jgi:lipoyl(octanoyl) transferase
MRPAPTEETAAAALPPCAARWLGSVPYAQALTLQDDLVARRAAGEVPDQLLLLEHPHVLTLGRGAKGAHVLVDRAGLAARGVDLFETGRGGDVTYHGPGQLVAYPILDLAPDRCDLHRYVRDLERVMMAVLTDFGVEGHVVPGRTGVWVDRAGLPPAKIGAIGVRVARWITSHGIALNVTTDLAYFDLIVPCGLQGAAVTSLSALAAGHGASRPAAGVAVAAAPSLRDVARRFVVHFGAVFGRRMGGMQEWGSVPPGEEDV